MNVIAPTDQPGQHAGALIATSALCSQLVSSGEDEAYGSAIGWLDASDNFLPWKQDNLPGNSSLSFREDE
jgi:hypothetical protein